MDPSKMQTEALAGAYAQVAGLLAGFAFVCLANYLGSDRRRTNTSSADVLGRRISVTLFSAFAALVLISVLYALLTGEGDATARANTGIVIIGLPFGLSVLTLFFALTLMATERDFNEMIRLGRVLVVIVGPAIVHLRLMNALSVLETKATAQPSPYQLGIALVVALLMVSSVAYLTTKTNRDDQHRQKPLIATAATTHAGLLIAVAAAFLASFVAAQPEAYKPARVTLYVIAIAAFVLLAAFATCAAWAIRDATAATPLPRSRMRPANTASPRSRRYPRRKPRLGRRRTTASLSTLRNLKQPRSKVVAPR
ncbi:hypothetical protein ABZ783_24795 [Micromonospora sp. NPDC047738]|uniref:hypothetical protein n=1 Tax=Micromonospora sp. NPDC047738 TaxID=3155741 RepID=UPI0033E7C591